MGFLNQSAEGWKKLLPGKRAGKLFTLADAPKGSAPKTVLPYVPKSLTKTTNDIKTWNDAISSWSAEEPKNFQLQMLYSDAMIDALLTSQIENRNNQVYSVDFSIKKASGEIDQVTTDLIAKSPIYRKLTNAILNARYYGYSLGELSLSYDANKKLSIDFTQVPRTNVVPQKGYFYNDYTEDKFIKYREIQEYGTYVLEFLSDDLLGLLNKAIPPILFKKFALSCWSELCEIYGIPPRYMKTNTQDPKMLNRAEAMMTDMGAAAWFIIDEHETFEFANGVATNGDVYKNLIACTNNEVSMLISGAIIGQDTKNGSNSKETASQELLSTLVYADMAIVEQQWNSIILPALSKLGIIPIGLEFEFDPTEDLEALFKRNIALAPYANLDEKLLNEKFGTYIKTMKEPIITNTNLSSDFFH